MPHLVPLVASLLGQDYSNLEIVFSEGGGTDGSSNYLLSLTDPRVRVIHQAPGTSAAENWTAVTRAATGTYTKLICQDDLLHPTAIRDQVGDLISNPEAVMAIATRDIIDAQGRIVYANRGLSGLRGHVMDGHEVLRVCYVRGTNVIGEPLAVLFQTRALQEVMPWDGNNPLMLDLTTYSKVASRGDVVLRYQPVGAFRVSASSWSTRIATRQVAQTRSWQEEYASTCQTSPRTWDRVRAAVGRHVQANRRRTVYAILRLRGAMDTPTPPTMQR
jgi:glycosyltransferase involved in cell wall biosynthesis